MGGGSVVAPGVSPTAHSARARGASPSLVSLIRLPRNFPHMSSRPHATTSGSALALNDMSVCEYAGWEAFVNAMVCFGPRDRVQILGIRHTGKFEQAQVVHSGAQGTVAANMLEP